MSKKYSLDKYDVKSLIITILLMFSPVILAFLWQLQIMQFDWMLLWGMFIWIVLKTFQKFIQDNSNK